MLFRFALLLLLAWPGLAQFHVQFKPEALITSTPIFGSGRDVGKWTILVCNDYPTQQAIDRSRILLAAPEVHELPASETEDQLTRKAAADQRSIIGNTADQLLGFAGDGSMIGGFAVGNNIAEYVGLGLKGIQFFFRIYKTAHAAPNPAPHLTEMLPDQISLAGGRCEREHWVVASLVHGAHTIDATIWLPGTQPGPPPGPLPASAAPAHEEAQSNIGAVAMRWIYPEMAGF